jgi:hypothetical protein
VASGFSRKDADRRIMSRGEDAAVSNRAGAWWMLAELRT